MADTGEGFVWCGPVWREPWDLAWYVFVSSQDKTLVFCGRNASDSCAADHGGGILSGEGTAGDFLKTVRRIVSRFVDCVWILALELPECLLLYNVLLYNVVKTIKIFENRFIILGKTGRGFWKWQMSNSTQNTREV